MATASCTDDDTSQGVWRSSRLTLGFGWLVSSCLALTAVGLAAAAVAKVVGDDWRLAGGLAAGGVGSALVAALVRRMSIHPRVLLTDSGVEVINPWGTASFTWAEISGSDAGYSGVAIRSRSGRSVSAWAVQKSNLSTWLGRQTRADRLVATIRLRVHQHT